MSRFRRIIHLYLSFGLQRVLGLLSFLAFVSGCDVKLEHVDKRTKVLPAMESENKSESGPDQSSGSSDQVDLPTPTADDFFTISGDTELGILTQGERKDVSISLRAKRDFVATSVQISGTGIRFLSGTYPGDGGDCELTFKIGQTCKFMLQFEAIHDVPKRQNIGELMLSIEGRIYKQEFTLTFDKRFLLNQLNFRDQNFRAAKLSVPRGIWTDGTKLLITSYSESRVLGWHKMPTSPLQAPDFTLGSTAPQLLGHPVSDEWSCPRPGGVYSDGTRIVVSCMSTHRVMIWNKWPEASYPKADVVLGQPNFSDTTANHSGVDARGLNQPDGVLIHEGALYIADQGNHRVLIFDQIPTQNFAAADRVLGQLNFTTRTPGRSAVIMRTPYDLTIAGNRLWVSDGGNHRVLGFDSVLPASAAAATTVLGQTNFTLGAANKGGTISPSSLNRPQGIAGDEHTLYVTDYLNYRALKFVNPASIADNAEAVQVYGAPDFTSVGVTDPVTSTSLNSPYSVAIGPQLLVLSQANGNRVSMYQRSETANNPEPFLIYGQDRPDQVVFPAARETPYFCEHGKITRKKDWFLLSCYYSHRILVWKGMPSHPREPAHFVIGQADFNSKVPNAGGVTNAKGLNRPNGVDMIGNMIYVTDALNHRILGFDWSTPVNFPEAKVVIGQPDFTSGAANRGLPAPDANTLSSPSGMAIFGDIMTTFDANNRALFYKISTFSEGDIAAYLVLGQAGFQDKDPNRGQASPDASTLAGGARVWTDGRKVAVSDFANNRLLLWNNFPQTNGAAADVVLAQNDFSSYAAAQFPSASGVSQPNDVTFQHDRIFLLDRMHSRILVWHGWPTMSGKPADDVLFQPDFFSGKFGIGADRVSDIIGMQVWDGEIYVSDRYNYRNLSMPVD